MTNQLFVLDERAKKDKKFKNRFNRHSKDNIILSIFTKEGQI